MSESLLEVNEFTRYATLVDKHKLGGARRVRRELHACSGADRWDGNFRRGVGTAGKKFRPVGPIEYNTHPNAKENKKRSRGEPCGVPLTRGYV
jgi:hypothetical protein